MIKNEELFLELMDRYSERLWRYIVSIEYNSDYAKDIYSETVFAAYTYFETLHKPEAFLSWIITIARRYRIKNLNRKKNDRIERDVDYDTIAGIEATPEEKMEYSELFGALDQLPEKQKEAILLTAVYGFSRIETAEIQQTSQFNVKNRIARGRKKLKEILGGEYE
jgi:RNA polymerase sigma-70 factor (ECF subfamily)